MKKQMPSGLKWIIWLLIIGIVFDLLMLATMQSFDVLALFGASGTLGMFISTVFGIIIIGGIYKASPLSYKLVVLLLILSLASAVIGSAAYFIGGGKETGVVVSIAFALLIEALFLWYVTRIKPYFTAPDFNVNDDAIVKNDKLFKKSIIAIIVLMFIGSMILGAIVAIEGFSSTNSILAQFEEFNGNALEENLALCNSKPAAEKDQCINVLVAYGKTSYENFNELETCNLIENEKTRYACYVIIKRCDLIENAQVKKYCEMENAFSALSKQ